MLYRLLKWLFYPTVYGYFRSLTVKGLSNVPDSGAIIFVANHNSAFMDPILLGVHIKQSIYFLARGEAFKSKLSSWIFGNLNMIPVYRPEVTPDKMHKNKEVFQRCFDHLGKGKTLMIFPEGFSKTVRNLRQLKTGAARIALGAEDENDFQLGVTIVPIGINYSDPHTFRSDVFINFGRPLQIKDYMESYKENEKDCVLELTSKIEGRLKELLVILEDEKLSKLVRQIEILYRNQIEDKAEPSEKQIDNFNLSRNIAQVVQYYKKEYPSKVTSLENKVGGYFEKLAQLSIRDKQIKHSKKPLLLISNFMFFILTAPIFFYGCIVNLLPYTTVRLLSSKIQVREDFVGSLKLALGAFVFLIFYIVQMIVFAALFNWVWAILFVVSLYPAGVFTIHFIRNFYLFGNELRFRNSNKDEIEELKANRTEIIELLQEVRELYSSLHG